MALIKAVNILRNTTKESGHQLIWKRLYSQLMKYQTNLKQKKFLQESKRTTSSSVGGDKHCGKKSSGVTTCHKDLEKQLESCKPKKMPKWPGPCMKVCLPCCRPIDIPVACDRAIVKMNLCSGIQYKYPSYTETVENVGCNLPETDCCKEILCRKIYPIGQIKLLTKLKESQKNKLGMSPNNSRYFSTYTNVLYTKKNDNQFQSNLPCLKKSENGKKGAKQTIVKGECKKICMPCCKPARDPPDCFFPYIKPECKKHRAPRPAFSECQAEKMKIAEPCECSLVILPKCQQTKAGKKGGKEKCETKK